MSLSGTTNHDQWGQDEVGNPEFDTFSLTFPVTASDHPSNVDAAEQQVRRDSGPSGRVRFMRAADRVGQNG